MGSWEMGEWVSRGWLIGLTFVRFGCEIRMTVDLGLISHVSFLGRDTEETGSKTDYFRGAVSLKL
jgi:hypothetical protein